MHTTGHNNKCDSLVITQYGATYKTFYLQMIAKTKCCLKACLLSMLADSTCLVPPSSDNLVSNDLPVYKKNCAIHQVFYPYRNIKPFKQIVESLSGLFYSVKDKSAAHFSVRVSACQIWGANEELRDLLSVHAT